LICLRISTKRRRAVEINPRNETALVNLWHRARCRYAVTGDIGVIEEAVSVPRAALRIDPGNEAALAVLARLGESRGPADTEVPGPAPRDSRDQGSQSQCLFSEQVRVVEVSYRNAIEVILGGSGFLMVGAMLMLRIVRDWSSARRAGAVAATMTESAARRSTTYADLAEWLAHGILGLHGAGDEGPQGSRKRIRLRAAACRR
jgi:hypothetical protein